MKPPAGDTIGHEPSAAAILVVHGIGEQASLSSVDRVSRGLRTVLGVHVRSMSHTTSVIDGRVASGVCLDLSTSLPRSGANRIDVFEGYWAPLAAGLLTAQGVFAWITQTLLGPFRNWSKIRLDDISLGRRFEIIVGEVVAAIAFLFVATAMIVATIWYARTGGLKPFDDYDFGLWFFVELAAGVAALGFLVLAIKGTLVPLTRTAIRRARYVYVTRFLEEPVAVREHGLIREPFGDESRRIWGRTAWVGFVPVTVAVVLIEVFVDNTTCPASKAKTCRETIDKARELGDDQRLWVGALLLIAWMALARFLKSIAADVAVYVAEDADSAAGRLRSHILANIVGQIRSLLDSGDYDTVHVVGHSLGTIIGYDALNQLRVEVEHGARRPGGPHDAVLSRESYERIGSLITVACPLDHVNYFFRSVASDARPIQDQLAVRRSGLRRRGGLYEAGTYRLDEDFDTGVRRGYYPIEPSRFAWLNIKASPDPIGTKLLHYDPDETRRIRYSPLTLSAHVKVMEDRRTYEMMLRYL